MLLSHQDILLENYKKSKLLNIWSCETDTFSKNENLKKKKFQL